MKERDKTEIEQILGFYTSDWFEYDIQESKCCEDCFTVTLRSKYPDGEFEYTFDTCYDEEKDQVQIDMNDDGDWEDFDGESIFRWLYFKQRGRFR